MSDQWKAIERRVARKLGGQRVGCTGRDTPDVVTELADVEVKYRATLPLYLKAAMAQAVRNAADGKLPLLVLAERYQRDMLVVLRLSDFVAWFGDPFVCGKDGDTD